jgi:DNA-binding MarR family transcriptional regulator
MKPGPNHSAAGAALTELILSAYLLHGPIVRIGDAHSRPYGLSAARWQLLSLIAEALATMATLARSLGLRRQAVRSSVAALREDGLVELVDNEHHRRAPLVRITTAGEDVLEALGAVQTEWANTVAESLSTRDLEDASRTLAALAAEIRRRSREFA